MKRSLASRLEFNSRGRNLIATSRFSRKSSALYTTPIPPRPIFSMMRYFPAHKLPRETSELDVMKVRVGASGFSSEAAIGAPHLLQKPELPKTSEWHFGHLLATFGFPLQRGLRLAEGWAGSQTWPRREDFRLQRQNRSSIGADQWVNVPMSSLSSSVPADLRKIAPRSPSGQVTG